MYNNYFWGYRSNFSFVHMLLWCQRKEAKYQMRLKSENEKGSRDGIIFLPYFFPPFFLLILLKSYYFFVYEWVIWVIRFFFFSFFFFHYFGNFVTMNYIISGFFLLYFIAVDLSMMIGPIMEGHGNRGYQEGWNSCEK